MFSLAVPQHLYYRDIRTRLHNPSLWSWLSRKDDLRAFHIRSLTILPDQNFDFFATVHSYDLRKRLPPNFTPIPLTANRDVDACRRSEASLVSTLKRTVRLKRFRWYRLPRPLLYDADDIWTTLQNLGTVKELDIYDDDKEDAELPSVILSNTFNRFRDLTTLKIRTSARSPDDLDDSDILLKFQSMILNSLPDLEVLCLELDLDEMLDGTASINSILRCAYWPRIRVLRLSGMNCRVAFLTRFITAHPSLEELALAKMTPGHLWTRLANDLPSDALPNLRHLECSSSQAAALLKHPRPNLETLLDVELHNKINDSQYFGWDHEWEEYGHDDHNADEEQESPRKAALLDCLKTQGSIIRLSVFLSSPQDVQELSVVAPQIKEVKIGVGINARFFDTEWYRLYSLFQSLEVIHNTSLIWFDRRQKVVESAEQANTHVQALASACPRLKVITIGTRWKKAVIIRENKGEEIGPGVKWVLRHWTENEEATVRNGERVYGPL